MYFSIAKIIISLLIFGFIIYLIPIDKLHDFYSINVLSSMLIGSLLFSIGHIVAAYRWKYISDKHNNIFPYLWYLRTYYESVALSLILPSSIGGDMWRIGRQAYLLKKTYISIQNIILDRLSGLLIAIVLCIISFYFCYEKLTYNINNSITLILSIFTIVILLLVLVVKNIKKFRWLLRSFENNREQLNNLLKFLSNYKNILNTLFLAIIIQSITVCVLVSFLINTNINISIEEATFAVMSAILASTIPITFGGWGIREGALIIILTNFGVPTATSIKISLMFGIALLLSALPGAGAFLFLSKTNKIPK
jgi:uncharacterized protein (TIRG00374 family)